MLSNPSELRLCCLLRRTQSQVASAVSVVSRGMPRPRPSPSPSLRCSSFPAEPVAAVEEVELAAGAVVEGAESDEFEVIFSSRTVKLALRHEHVSQYLFAALTIQRCIGSS